MWYPATWQLRELEAALTLVPPDPSTDAGGPTEAYFVLGDSVAGTGISDPAAPEVGSYLDQQVRSILPQLQRSGPPTPVAATGGKAVRYDWAHDDPDGPRLAAFAYAELKGQWGVSLLAIGLHDSIAGREDVLRRIFLSFAMDQAARDPRLIGHWSGGSYYSTDGFSSQTSRSLILIPDGRFVLTSSTYLSLDGSDSFPTDVWADLSDEERGQWAGANGQLFLFFDSGSSLVKWYHIDRYDWDSGSSTTCLLLRSSPDDTTGTLWEIEH
jgi:hypothetical protein